MDLTSRQPDKTFNICHRLAKRSGQPRAPHPVVEKAIVASHHTRKLTYDSKYKLEEKVIVFIIIVVKHFLLINSDRLITII